MTVLHPTGPVLPRRGTWDYRTLGRCVLASGPDRQGRGLGGLPGAVTDEHLSSQPGSPGQEGAELTVHTTCARPRSRACPGGIDPQLRGQGCKREVGTNVMVTWAQAARCWDPKPVAREAARPACCAPAHNIGGPRLSSSMVRERQANPWRVAVPWSGEGRPGSGHVCFGTCRPGPLEWPWPGPRQRSGQRAPEEAKPMLLAHYSPVGRTSI